MDEKTKALVNALILAYVKLKQIQGFDYIEGNRVYFAGMHIPDKMAEKQILDAIHQYEPNFSYDPQPPVG